MANTLGITEVTLLEASTATNAVNTEGWWDRPQVIRITDHASNVTSEVGTDTDQMAIFERPALGHPWERRGTQHGKVIFQQLATPTAVPTNVEVLFPNFDYGTFQ